MNEVRACLLLASWLALAAAARADEAHAPAAADATNLCRRPGSFYEGPSCDAPSGDVPATAPDAATNPDPSVAAPEASSEAEPPPPLSAAEAKELAWKNLDPRSEGAGVGTASLDIGALDATAANGHHGAGGAGFSFKLIARRKNWPVMVGLGIGIMYFGGSTSSGPYYSGSERDGSFYVGPTQQDTSVELRHAEIATRFQPWWWPVRPYLEGEFGLVGLWNTSNLNDDSGASIYKHERQRSVSFLAAFGGGIDIRIWRMKDTDPINRWELILNLGIKRVFTGNMASPVYLADDNGHVKNVHERLRIWQPYLSIGFAGKSKPRPPQYPAPTPYQGPRY